MDTSYQALKFILRIYQLVFSQDCHARGVLDIAPGPKIIAANHLNVTDGFHLPFVFHEKLHFFIQGNIFSFPILGWLLAKSGQVPVDLNPALKKPALEQGLQLLKNGKTVVIFPEGILNPDRQPLKAYGGAVWLSLITGAVIIPVGFYVPDRNLRSLVTYNHGNPSRGRWQTSGHCYAQIGCSWLPCQEVGGKLNSAAVHALTARLMEKIEGLAHLAYQDCVNENLLLSSVSRYS